MGVNWIKLRLLWITVCPWYTVSALYRWQHPHLQWDSLLNKGNLACTAHKSAYLSQTLPPPFLSLLLSCFLTTSLHPWTSTESHHPPNVHCSTVEINYASGWAILGVMREKEWDWLKQNERRGQKRKKGNKKRRRTEQISTCFSEGKKNVFFLRLECILGSDQGWYWEGFALHHLLKIALNILCPRLSDMRSEMRDASVSSPALLPLPHSQVKQGGEDENTT